MYINIIRPNPLIDTDNAPMMKIDVGAVSKPPLRYHIKISLFPAFILFPIVRVEFFSFGLKLLVADSR